MSRHVTPSTSFSKAIASKHFLSSICFGTGCCKRIPLTDESLFKVSISYSSSSVDVSSESSTAIDLIPTRVGIKSIAVELSEDTSTEELLYEIDTLNKDSSVNGILLQHPVPKQIDERKCFDAIALEKDVDGVTCLDM